MFGNNEKVGKSFFTKNPEAQAGKLFITSMFMTLQGEGPYRGEPAFFIRLAKCSLACSFCDTYFDDGEWLSIEEISQRIDIEITKFFNGDTPSWAQVKKPRNISTTSHTYIPSSYKRQMVLVITGGEPTLQSNLFKLLEWGEKEFDKTQIESHGILVSKDIVPYSTTVVVSPKCREQQVVTPKSDEHPSGYFMQAVEYLKPSKNMLDRADCLKFVMEAPAESSISIPNPWISPYSSIPDWAHEWAKETGKPVFVSPMNVYRQEPQKAKELRAKTNQTTIEERSTYDEVISFWEEGLLDMKANQRNHEWAAKYAIQHGFIFNVQIHLLASVA